jgi:glutathione synthase/RimK-type ligase-like ATP-grasp enzyme
MSKELIFLTDYKGNFGSKFNSNPYRSGFDKEKLREIFFKKGLKVEFMQFSDVDFNLDWQGKIVLYTSSEESKYYYKGFIEDIVLSLDRIGARCLPDYDHLRSNNNKVYMELFLKSRGINNGLDSKVFGCLDEIKRAVNQGIIKFPAIVKLPEGAKSRGVFLVNTGQQLFKICKRHQFSSNFKLSLIELVRRIRHRGYQPQSAYQRKIVLQKFVPDLKNDWKVLIFENKCFVLSRGVKPNDFRASGSGFGYSSGSDSKIPKLLLNYAKSVYQVMNVPHISLDLAFDGQNPYLLEFQSIFFGLSTILMSKDYFDFSSEQWIEIPSDTTLEDIYAESIMEFLVRKL